MELTAKTLKEILKDIPDDTTIRIQHIKDKYLTGYNNQGQFVNGWVTEDLPCDLYVNCPDYQRAESYCNKCPDRERYITATRCFIYNKELYIDGNY